MGQYGDEVPEAVGLDSAALTGRQINEWFDRADRPEDCAHEETFRAGPHLACRGCGASEQDYPAEHRRVVFAEFSDAGGPNVRADVHADGAVPLPVTFATAAARRKLDEEARAEAAGLPVDCRWPL
jgi:hypothetical protein